MIKNALIENMVVRCQLIKFYLKLAIKIKFMTSQKY